MGSRSGWRRSLGVARLISQCGRANYDKDFSRVLEQTGRDEMVSTMPSFVRHCLPVVWPKRSRNLRQGAFICLGQSDVALMGLCPLFVVAVLRASMRDHLSSQMKLSTLSHHRL